MTRLVPVRCRSHADAEARFEALYARYYASVLAYVLRRIASEGAPDVVAETFIVAWRRIDRVPAEPLPWLLSVARKTLANHRRAERRQQAVISKLERDRLDADVPFATELGEVDVVARAVRLLPEVDQELLKLVLWDGLWPKEAARVVGISHAACRVRLHRAKRRLAAELAARGVVAEGTPAAVQIREGLET